MTDWAITFHSDFYKEFLALSERVQDELLASLVPLGKLGPNFRPTPMWIRWKRRSIRIWKSCVSTPMMASGVSLLRFDPRRTAILLVAGDKSGTGQERFYKQLIKKADARLDDHLRQLKGEEND